MKRLAEKILVGGLARTQLREYENLLSARTVLKEREHLLPFFSKAVDLSMLFSHYIPAIRRADRFAAEFKIYGDFVADMIVGDHANGKYLLIEYEDGTPSGIFEPRRKTAPSWSRRFEHAFSQIVDWLWKLEDMRSTRDFERIFGTRDVSFNGLIVIGKGMVLDRQERDRLRWRQDKVMVDSKSISVVSFDEFRADADHWLRHFHRA